MISRPSFFIVGAPKSGTTSWVKWLGEHTEIFFPTEKEPHFFNTDSHHRKVRSIDRYHELFSTTGPQHKACGEASVFYMMSAVAIPNIIKYRADAKIIACIRNPIDMAYSFHDEMVASGMENIENFAAAWDIGGMRDVAFVSRWCSDIELLNYKNVCRIGSQLERLVSHVPPEQLHVIPLDDVIRDPRAEYEAVVKFLELEDDRRMSFPTMNRAKQRRSRIVHRALTGLGTLKRWTGLRRNYGLGTRLNSLNTRTRDRPPLPRQLRHRLAEEFRPEVEKTSHVLSRDFSHWLDDPARATET